MNDIKDNVIQRRTNIVRVPLTTECSGILDILIYEGDMGLTPYNNFNRDKIIFLEKSLGGIEIVMRIISKHYHKHYLELKNNDYYVTQDIAIALNIDINNYKGVLRKCQKHLEIVYLRNNFFNKQSDNYKSRRYEDIFKLKERRSYVKDYLYTSMEKVEANIDKQDRNVIEFNEQIADITDKLSSVLKLEDELDIINSVINIGTAYCQVRYKKYQSIANNLVKRFRYMKKCNTYTRDDLCAEIEKIIKLLQPDKLHTEEDKIALRNNMTEFNNKRFKRLNSVYGVNLY